jgi:ribosome maturation factor RimP
MKSKKSKKAGRSKQGPKVSYNTDAVVGKANELASSLCESEGMELVLAELAIESGNTLLRFYIDKPGGVTMDDCSFISRELGDLLDVHLNIPVPYRLEVSSPGIDRPLTKEQDFETYKGKNVRIKTDTPIDGQRNFNGSLLGLTNGNVEIMANDKAVAIPYARIKKARLVNDIGDFL